jgi:ferric-dicitrate binding protein FerR (iron transport regulator)
MNFSDADRLELNELCNALVDGVITDTQRARLEHWLATSDEARRFYVRAMALSASLIDYAGEMQSEAPDAPLEEARIVRPAAWWWTLGSLAAAAAIVLAFWLGGAGQRKDADEIASATQDGEESIARLSGAKESRWSGTALQPGEELHRGQQIELASGFAEITFDCGAQVTLEGPASLDLHSAWDAVLRRGTLKASVPAEAIGFRVSNASVNVVDLGTEFSMVADENGATEVFVLKGAVEAASRDASGNEGRPVVLREKQARRFARAGASEVRDREAKLAKFMRKVALERSALAANYVHWSFDETTGSLAAASVPGREARLEAADDALAAAHITGHRAGGLRLDGQIFAKAAFPGIRQRTARTVAFWLNVAAEAPLPDAGTILAWPIGGAGRGIEIGWNRNPVQGPLGALRTEAGRSFVVGSTSLRDGRWHHVAVVFSPKGKSETAMQVRQYVDGRLESPSDRRFAKRLKAGKGGDALASAADEFLWIGRGLGGKAAGQFRGDLDELFLADAALTPQEIRHLMRENKPATPEILAAQ